MNAQNQSHAAQPLDRRILPTFVLFGAAALIWLAGIGAARAGAETAAPARAAAERANSGAATLSQLLILHRQATAASNSAAVFQRASGPCCAHAAEAK
ncbi:MAG: hypothetical protein WBP72_06490 [Rhodocyclaceae bacterium]